MQTDGMLERLVSSDTVFSFFFQNRPRRLRQRNETPYTTRDHRDHLDLSIHTDLCASVFSA